MGQVLKISLLGIVLNHSQIGPHQIKAEFKIFPLGWMFCTNLLALLCSLGLAWPWAKVRMTKMILESISITTGAPLAELTAASGDQVGATGQEVAQMFDVDIAV